MTHATTHELILVGLNHHTAPVEIRECLAFSEAQTDRALVDLRRHPEIEEVVVMSTCNRVEILVSTSDGKQAADHIKAYVAGEKELALDQFAKLLYVYSGAAAVRHLFRVAASLDSMMVGEPQILGQLKSAYHRAVSQKTSGVLLNRIFHRAFFTAKRIRTETGIGDHAVSISFAAVELAKKIFDHLEEQSALLIGAGEMAELAVEHLIRQRIKTIRVVNRTFENGVALARRFGGHALAFEEIVAALTASDIIISSTGATQYVVTKEIVKAIMRTRKNRPLFFIDIAVPRDIDPTLNKLNNVYVYDIDDLQNVVEDNIQDRQQEAVKGERLVDEAVITFLQWYENLNVVPTIKNLRAKISNIVEQEFEKTLSKDPALRNSMDGAMNGLKQSLVNKIMHDPALFLKGNGCHENRAVYLDFIRKLFNLDTK